MAALPSVLLFFVVSCVLTAACQAPAILAFRSGVQPEGIAMLLMAIGSSGPTLVAIALSAMSGGRSAVRELFRRRGNAAWYFYPIALFHILVAHLLGTAALALVGQSTAAHLVYPPVRPEHFAIAIVAPLGEEYGWRAFALPRLQSVMRPLPASLLIGAVWAIWHLPTFFVPGASIGQLAWMMPLTLAGSVIYTWLYNATGGSMRIILLAHLGAHIDNVFRGATTRDGYAPLFVTILLLAIFAAVLAATGRLSAERAIRWQWQTAPGT